MKALPCEVVKDLYPTVKDGCAGAQTDKLVKAHLRSCPECKMFYRERRVVSRNISCIPKGDFSAVARRIRIRNAVTAAVVTASVAALAVYAFFGKKGGTDRGL